MPSGRPRVPSWIPSTKDQLPKGCAAARSTPSSQSSTPGSRSRPAASPWEWVVGGTTQQTQDWTAWLLAQPLGAWLVGLIGAAVVANGVTELFRACKSRLTEDLSLTDVGARHAVLITRLGRAGYA